LTGPCTTRSGFFKDDLVDDPDHLPRPHFAQVTAALARRAGGEFFRQHIEGFALGDALLERFGLFGGFHQDMAGLSFHGSLPWNCGA
jgi:hypothetical protein